MVKQEVVIGVFKYAESKSWPLFLDFGHFLVQTDDVFARSWVNAKFLGKTKQSDFPEYMPLTTCMCCNPNSVP